MNSATLRRLAADQASIRKSTPPNYLFPDEDQTNALPDDLTQLTIMLTGPQATPYSNGLWRICLKMPEDYPKNPPKATFKTRIYHPNVEESTGAVCLDTLKRDWQSKLTLRDILVTISCLLIHPNPDSALNAAAGALLQENYEAFAKQARLMTSVHAPIPADLKVAAVEAKQRGEVGNLKQEETGGDSYASRKTSISSSVVMKKSRQENKPDLQERRVVAEERHKGGSFNASEERNPAQQSLATTPTSPKLVNDVLGKRQFSEVSSSADPAVDHPPDLMPSDTNTATLHSNQSSAESTQPARKAPKIEMPFSGLGDDKENIADVPEDKALLDKHERRSSMDAPTAPRPQLRKVSNLGAGRGKQGPRTGIRRL